MPESGILKNLNGALVLTPQGYELNIEGAPFQKYCSMTVHIADVDEAVKEIDGFDMKQVFCQYIPEGHNKFALKIWYVRPPLIEGGKITKTFEPQSVGGKIMWRATGE